MAAIVSVNVATKTSIPIACTMLSFVMLSSPLLALLAGVRVRAVQDLVELLPEELFILRVLAIQH